MKNKTPKINNLVAKHARTFNKAKVEESKLVYNRKMKFKPDNKEGYQILFA